MSQVVKIVRKSLIKASDQTTKDSTKRYFKNEVLSHGVKTNIVDKVAKENYELIKDKPKKEIFALAEELFASGFMEESWLAADWLYKTRKKFAPEDITTFERWIDSYIDNWAECDTLCNHSVAAFIEAYPAHVKTLKKWAKSPNLWLRRASAVTLVLPARSGKFLEAIFDIADVLLLDREDMVQKGYGWMLKEASKAHQKEVFDYVMKHKSVMPRTALRYAIEKMPTSLRIEAMKR